MSLNKAIESGKEHRKQYRKSKSVDRTCRNHISCPYSYQLFLWCRDNRMYKYNKVKEKADSYMEEIDEEIQK